MNIRPMLSPSKVAASAGQAAALLRALSNENRLLILCHLIGAGELSVGQIVERVGLSQSALSQHLAKLREEGLVDFRREAQMLHYRVADERAGKVLEVLYDIFCAELGGKVEPGDSRMSAAEAVCENRTTGE